jgi:hypothetical protein
MTSLGEKCAAKEKNGFSNKNLNRYCKLLHKIERGLTFLNIKMQEEKKDVPLVMKRNGKMVKVNTKTASNAVEKADSSSAAAPAVNLKQFISPKKNIVATVSWWFFHVQHCFTSDAYIKLV